MKKEKRIINLGKTFEEDKKIEEGFYNQYLTLGQCYKTNWSDTKQEVYDDYKKMLTENCEEVEKYGIKTYCGNFITLHAIVKKDGKRYYLYITKQHNRFKEIGE